MSVKKGECACDYMGCKSGMWHCRNGETCRKQ